jgi:hypothetical protein
MIKINSKVKILNGKHGSCKRQEAQAVTGINGVIDLCQT